MVLNALVLRKGQERHLSLFTDEVTAPDPLNLTTAQPPHTNYTAKVSHLLWQLFGELVPAVTCSCQGNEVLVNRMRSYFEENWHLLARQLGTVMSKSAFGFLLLLAGGWAWHLRDGRGTCVMALGLRGTFDTVNVDTSGLKERDRRKDLGEEIYFPPQELF